jgi:hypothetical protein
MDKKDYEVYIASLSDKPCGVNPDRTIAECNPPVYPYANYYGVYLCGICGKEVEK